MHDEDAMRTLPALTDPRLVAAFQRASGWMACTGVAIGGLVLLGWLLNLDALRSVHPSFAQMKVNTAIGFALVGIALALQHAPVTHGRRRLARIGAQLALALGGLTLLEYALHLNLGIDQFLISETGRTPAAGWPGRMSAPTALGLTLIAFALASIDRTTREDSRLTQWLALGAVLIATVVLAGYLYGAKALYGASGRGQIAPHTAVALMLLGLGTLCARPERGLMQLLTSRAATGTLARRLLPLVIAIPMALGLARLVGQHSLWWGQELGTAFEVVGNVVCLAVVSFWIVQRQLRAELELTEREQDLATTLHSIGDAVIATDDAGRVVRMNPVAENLTGWRLDQARGRSLGAVFRIVDEISGEPLESPAEVVVREGRIIGLVDDVVLWSKDGTRRPITDSAAPIRDARGIVRGVVLVFRDLTPQRRAEERHETLAAEARAEQQKREDAEQALQRTEEQLRQTQKMEAIGTLAGGIAHDFNNILTVILSYADLLLRDTTAPKAVLGDVAEIKQAAFRAAELTRQLLAFSRKQVLQPCLLDLNEVVARVGKMLGRLIGEQIELRLLLAPDLGKVEVDPGQFEQVLMNLVVNARDAMPHGGSLVIETANVVLDSQYASQYLQVEPGDYVMVSVSDTGIGMDRTTQARIFEPFFSTKTKDKGTGLGLSTVFGIMKQSGGSIWVDSEPGKGSAFKLYLPRCRHEHVPRATDVPEPTSLRGSETVLLAEDDQQLRALMAQVLSRYGYRVLQAADGIEAIQRAENYAGAIDLLLTDVVMPRMGGRELAERLVSIRPQTKVLLMSGYTDDEAVIQGVLAASLSFIQKPVEPADLLSRVRSLLDSDRGSASPGRG